MNALARVELALPALVDRAAQTLAGARTSAEILEARDLAGVAYDAAKRAARFAKAKGAHDALMAAINRAQADALEIEAGAKRRLADEYDAAQERGEVRPHGNKSEIPVGNITLAEIGISAKQIHEAREIRDAEQEHPGIVRRVLDDALDAGEEPTRAKLKRATSTILGRTPAPRAGRDAICAQVKTGLITLCGLPPASEVARYFHDFRLGADRASSSAGRPRLD